MEKHFCCILFTLWSVITFCNLVGSAKLIKVCPSGWTVVRDNCYYFNDQRRSLTEAEAACKAKDSRSRLFAPSSQEELEAVIEQFSSFSRVYTLFGNKLASSKWLWDAGEEIEDALFCNGVNAASDAADETEVLTWFVGEGDTCLSVIQDADLASICQGDTQTYCPEGYLLHSRRCFRVESSEVSFQEAETFCNKLPGGHLAAFRDNSELEFLQRLSGSAGGITRSWIGLRIPDVTRSNQWRFTDGSFYEATDLQGGEDQACVTIPLEPTACGNAFPYICMTQAQRLINLESNDDRYQTLTDFDVTTCMNSTEVLSPQDYHMVDLIIPQKQEVGIITVYYSQDVNCAERQTMNIWRKNSACGNTKFLKVCKSISTGSARSTSCEYQCPCADDGCRVVVTVTKSEVKEQPGDICDVTYGN